MNTDLFMIVGIKKTSISYAKTFTYHGGLNQFTERTVVHSGNYNKRKR